MNFVTILACHPLYTALQLYRPYRRTDNKSRFFRKQKLREISRFDLSSENFSFSGVFWKHVRKIAKNLQAIASVNEEIPCGSDVRLGLVLRSYLDLACKRVMRLNYYYVQYHKFLGLGLFFARP
jgi:hypothetical protein